MCYIVRNIEYEAFHIVYYVWVPPDARSKVSGGVNPTEADV